MEVQPDYGKESYVGSGRLDGRAALITGGDSGIGRAVALAFAREGADVVISYLEGEQPDAEQIVEVRHVNDRVGLPIVRSEESRWGIPISLGSGPIPGLSPFPTFINTEVWGRLINDPANVTSVTLTTPVSDGTSGAHGSYMSHPAASVELMRELQRLFPELSLDVK